MRDAAQVFLLSPAYCAGRRAAILLRPGATSDLATRLRSGTLTLGEAFAFLSGLYFRGKLAYAEAFGRWSAAAGPAVLVITPTRGLMAPGTPVTPELITEFAGVDVASDDDRYRVPLARDLRALSSRLPENARVVLLGSIASDKYVGLLIDALGARLHYPPAFIGRGDMSRGGLLLRSARALTELDYGVLDATTTRHGPRPPKLEPLTRRGTNRPARAGLRLERVL
jgi:hypothetical protein